MRYYHHQPAMLDRNVFGRHSMRELSLCSLLRTPVVLKLEEDGEGLRWLRGFRRNTALTIAEQLDLQPEALEMLPRLRGLMRMSVFSHQPHPPGNQAACEVIQWEDGSVTLAEYLAGETGGLALHRLLPPLSGLEKLIHRPGVGDPFGERDWHDEQEQLVDMGMVHLANERITGGTAPWEEDPTGRHLKALLTPSTRLASAFRARLADESAA